VWGTGFRTRRFRCKLHYFGQSEWSRGSGGPHRHRFRDVHDGTEWEINLSGLPIGVYVVTPSVAGYVFSPPNAVITVLGPGHASMTFIASNAPDPAPTPAPAPAPAPAPTPAPTPAPVPIPHNVTLTWNMSTSPSITGYNVYRGATSGGPYSKLNSSPVFTTSYFDFNVAAGQTYFYVATTVQNTTESSYSTEARATIPSP